jgi:protein involved in polysaccharide export with SLBB domain
MIKIFTAETQRVLLLAAVVALGAVGQQQPVDTRVDQRVGEPAVGPVVAKSEVQPTTYTLGPEDQILVKVLDADEISTKDNAPIRIDSRGTITLPMVGRLTAAGLTTDQLEVEIETRLKKFIHEPDVSVYLTEMRSQPISILGSVTTPGVHQLQGRKTLFEALSLAGGLKPEAGHSVKITRRLEWGRIAAADGAGRSDGSVQCGDVEGEGHHGGAESGGEYSGEAV